MKAWHYDLGFSISGTRRQSLLVQIGMMNIRFLENEMAELSVACLSGYPAEANAH